MRVLSVLIVAVRVPVQPNELGFDLAGADFFDAKHSCHNGVNPGEYIHTVFSPELR